MTRLIFLVLFFLSVIAGAPFAGEMITHGPRELPQVALTFDLCQRSGARPSGFDAALVEILEREGVAATLFVGGLWLEGHPEEGKRLAANERFELASHSWSHPDLRKADAATISEEVEKTKAVLKNLTGKETDLFRLPYGWGDERVVKELEGRGVRVIQWDVVSGDPDPKVSAAEMTKTILKGATNGSIIIMHANGRGWHTAEALPAIIKGLRAKGLNLVTVSELLKEQP